MKKQWWKEAVIYQIYPRSFMDSDGDGIGDLNGITSRLDYLSELGVDVVWLSPCYASPNDDNGYDISDYRAIMPEFGTMDDFDLMLREMHKRGIRLVMDLVANHTSDEHEWFRLSRSSRDNPYRDYYIWRDARDGGHPNNWTSIFSGPAWEFDEATGQYYLHLFTKKQPDLNWENPSVREAVYDLMRFWLDKGIDGFRIDVANMYSKVPGLPDGGPEMFTNGPRIHEFYREMNDRVLSQYPHIMTVGETNGVSPQAAIQYVGEERGELNMVFQFEHMGVDCKNDDKWQYTRGWKLPRLKKILTRWQVELQNQGWNSLYLSNHDQPRLVSRFGDDQKYRVESAKMLATMLMTMQGTPYIYQGEELGMTNTVFSSLEDCRDVEVYNLFHDRLGLDGWTYERLLDAVNAVSRDHARTPMQWSGGKNAGFSAGTPWIAVNPNYPQINAEQALADRNSTFWYWKELIRLRRLHEVCVYGDFEEFEPENEALYLYARRWQGDILFVILNFTGEPQPFSVPGSLPSTQSKLYCSNYENADALQDRQLRPYEAATYLLH